MTLSARPLLPIVLAILLGSLAAPALHAQAAPPAPVAWNSLTPAQRDVLAPLAQEWNTMPPHRQQHMLEKSEQWVNLPPAKREQARENQRLFRQLPPGQREQLHAAYQRFQQLPPERRAQLMRQWHAMPPAQRLQWLHHGPENDPRPPPPHRRW